MEETITISKREYERLQKSEDLLDCLLACGVDNWNGCDTAYEMHHESYPVKD